MKLLLLLLGLALTVIGIFAGARLGGFVSGPSIRLGEATGFEMIAMAVSVIVAGVAIMIYGALR